VLIAATPDHPRGGAVAAMRTTASSSPSSAAAAYAAGRPQVICPYVADQPFWARLAQTHGVAPAPLPQRRLTEADLAAALTRATADPTLSRNAAILGKRVRAEGGVKAAVAALQRLSGGPS
jgi:sterol 3beta-glucosyltransferase